MRLALTNYNFQPSCIQSLPSDWKKKTKTNKILSNWKGLLIVSDLEDIIQNKKLLTLKWVRS